MADPNWEIKSFTASSKANPTYTFELSPTKQLPFGDDVVEIKFQGLQGNGKTNADISCSCTVGGGPIPVSSEKLFVLSYPSDKFKNLRDVLIPSISFNDKQSEIEDHQHLFVSNPALQPPIANKLKLNLKFSGDRPLVEKKDPNKDAPFFNISFSYGSSSTDLTDTLKPGDTGYSPLTTAYRIVASVDNPWGLYKSTDTKVWRIEPNDNNHQLFSRDKPNLDIYLEHIISRQEGEATMFIHWGGIAGYNDGWMARNIPKKKAPAKVISFTCVDGISKSTKIAYGKSVSLSFEVFGAMHAQLSCSENPALNQTLSLHDSGEVAALYYKKSVDIGMPVDPVNNFYLKLIDENGHSLGDEVGPVTVTIKEYPSSELSSPVEISNAIIRFSDLDEGAFYISPNEKHLDIKIDLSVSTTKIVDRILIQGPLGSTLVEVKDIDTTILVKVDYKEEGAYKIDLHGKNGIVITKSIRVNRLFNKQLSMQYSHGVFTKKTFILKNNDKIELAFTAEVKFEINRNGKGILSISPGPANKHLHFLDTSVNISFKPIPPIPFSWIIEPTYGTITINFDNGTSIVLSSYKFSPPNSAVGYQISTSIRWPAELHNEFTVTKGLNTLGITIENDDVIQKTDGSLKAGLVFNPPNQSQQLFFSSRSETMHESNNSLTRN